VSRELNTLLNEALATAVHHLKERRGFPAMAFGLTRHGEVVPVERPEGEPKGTPDEAVALLVDALRAAVGAGEYKATAVVTDVRLARPGERGPEDAVCVELEHEAAEAMTCYVPYSFASGEFKMGQLLAKRGSRTVFGPPPGPGSG
jgi:hypothetical protein